MDFTIQSISQSGLLGVGSIAIYIGAKYTYEKLFGKRVSKPTKHSFFNKIRYERDIQLPTIKLACHKKTICAGRTEVFRDMLKVKFTHWHDSTKEFVSKNNNNLSEIELENAAVGNIIDLVKKYEQDWKDMNIPKLVIEKFNEWHRVHADILINAIKSICRSASFSSNDERINAMLEIHKALIILTMTDAEKTLGDLNGELSGIIYKKIKLI